MSSLEFLEGLELVELLKFSFVSDLLLGLLTRLLWLGSLLLLYIFSVSNKLILLNCKLIQNFNQYIIPSQFPSYLCHVHPSSPGHEHQYDQIRSGVQIDDHEHRVLRVLKLQQFTTNNKNEKLTDSIAKVSAITTESTSTTTSTAAYKSKE